jgi:hypothetical protein
MVAALQEEMVMNKDTAQDRPLLIDLGTAKVETKGGQMKNGDTEGLHNFLTGLDRL